MTSHGNINQEKDASNIGTVITNFGNEILIESKTGERLRAIPKQSLPGLVTGDRVIWNLNENGFATISELLERHGILARELKNKQEKIVASNIDIALIICTHKPELKTGLIDRYIAACELADIEPHIVFNKTDTLPEKKRNRIENDLNIYRHAGYPVHYTSAKQSAGLKEIIEALHDKTAVLVGQSGVGKSSLIQALIPSASPRIADISNSTNKGRHTTTHSEIYHFNHNARLIDSPGIREFGLKAVDHHLLAHGFIEFRPFIEQCRFRDCQHNGEPGCALEQAVSDKKIAGERLESYRNILKSFQAE